MRQHVDTGWLFTHMTSLSWTGCGPEWDGPGSTGTACPYPPGEIKQTQRWWWYTWLYGWIKVKTLVSQTCYQSKNTLWQTNAWLQTRAGSLRLIWLSYKAIWQHSPMQAEPFVVRFSVGNHWRLRSGSRWWDWNKEEENTDIHSLWPQEPLGIMTPWRPVMLCCRRSW